MKTIVFIASTVLLFLASCTEDSFRDGDFFYLVNKDAKMPVLVRGNVQSNVFILFIHGGPGGTSLQKVGLPAFNELERSYAVVFWDQRGSGSSQGNSADKYLTLDQFVEDLDKLIDLLNYRYDNPTIFLMGHSWGGCLGTAYLTDGTRQHKIRGWIEVDGAHDNPEGDNLSMQWVTNYARHQIDAQIEPDFWKYVLDWYSRNPEFTSDQLEHYAFIEKSHGYIYDASVERDPLSFPDYSFQYIFGSPADISEAFTNYNHVIENFIISDIDLTPRMKDITIPTLIIWGEHDGIIPLPMAQQGYDALGTTPDEKKIVVLHNSAHYGYYEEPELFAASVAEFVDQYK